MQSQKHSLKESVVNTLIGFLVTLIFSPLIYWICGVKIHPGQVGLATILFTILSIARNYFVRRWYNHKTVKQNADRN